MRYSRRTTDGFVIRKRNGGIGERRMESPEPEVHDIRELDRDKIIHRSRILMETKYFRGEVEEDGTISVQEKDGSSTFILLTAKVVEVVDLIHVLTTLLHERKQLYGDEGNGK